MRNGFESINHKTSVVLTLAAALMILIASPVLAGEVSSSVDLKFWGRAIFNMHYDTALQAAEFSSYLKDDTQSEFNFNPRDTRLGFAASSTQDDWTYKAVFEMDFYGDNNGNSLIPRMRLGYAEAKNNSGLSIRGGQDWVPIAAQHPGTIDFGVLSWAGNLWWRVPQITMRYNTNNLQFLVGAMKHRISNGQEMQEKMPWLMGRIALNDALGDGSLLAIGGGFRSVTVDDNKYSPYLAALEFKVPFGSGGLGINGEVYYGAAVGREFVHYGFDYNPTNPNGPTEVKSMGGFLSLKAPVSNKVTLNFGVGIDNPDEDDLEEQAVVSYLKNTAIFGNMKYAVTKNFGWGLEVTHYQTEVGATDELTGQRFTGSWWYTF